MSSRQLRVNNSKHFKLTKSFTPESLAIGAKHTFEAKMTPVNGIQESIRLEVPIHSITDNREHLCLATVPKFLEARTDLQWTWNTTWARFYKVLDSTMRDYCQTIVDRDYSANNQKTQANFERLIQKLISESIPYEFPRNQIRDLMDNMTKPGDMTPTELWQRILELRTCCSKTAGTYAVPTIDDCKAKLIRALPQSIRDEMEKQSVTADSDITEILRLADVCNDIYLRGQASSSNNNSSRGRNRNQRQNDDNTSRTDRSRSRSRPAASRNRGNRNNNQNQGSNNGPDSQCRLPGHQGHLWKDCFQNPRGDNYRGPRQGGRSTSSRNNGSRNRDNSSNSNNNSSNHNNSGNNRSDSHHVQGTTGQGSAPQAASPGRQGIVPSEIGGADAHAVEIDNRPLHPAIANDDPSYMTLFSSQYRRN